MTIVYWTYGILLFAAFRLLVDGENLRVAFQFTTQFSYFAAGSAIIFVHWDRFTKKKGAFLSCLLLVSILVNALAVLQFVNPDHDLVRTALDWYGGVGDDVYAYEDF